MDARTLDPDGWTSVGEALLPGAIELRRAIHAEPELGLDLPKTTAKVKAALAGLPLEIREGPSTSGLVAILKGPANGRTNSQLWPAGAIAGSSRNTARTASGLENSTIGSSVQ